MQNLILAIPLLFLCLCAAVSGCSFHAAHRCSPGTTTVHVTITQWSLLNLIQVPACPE